MTKAPEKILRYRKPIIAGVATLAVYALLGFVAAPWLINKSAVGFVEENFGASLEIDKVSVNPFVLSLGIDGLALDTPEGNPFLRVDRYFVNFQTSSLFRWAWTFREHHVDGFEVFLARDGNGQLNVDFLTANSESAPPPPAEENRGPARLLVHDFAIRNSFVHWNDEVPPEAVDTDFGPINIAIADLNTLPERPGSQDVVITTESQGTLSWNGSLQFNPLHSEGRASIRGSHFPLTSAYLKHDVGFDVIEGVADVSLNYRLFPLDDGALAVEVNDIGLAFSDVLIQTFNQGVGRAGEDREVLRLGRIALTGGELRWPERTVSAALLTIDEADISLYRDPEGSLNVLPPAVTGEATTDTAATPASEPSAPWDVALDQFNINGLTLGLLDDSVSPTADIGWRSLDVGIQALSNQSGASFPTNITLAARDGGTIEAQGTFGVLPEPVLDFDLGIDRLALAAAHPYLQALVDVHLDSGFLIATAAIQSSSQNPFRLAGDVEIADFLITETDEGSTLGSWDSLLADNLVYSMADQSLDISEVRMSAGYGDILIAEDGSINLGRVRKGDAPEEDVPVDEPVDDEPEADEPSMAVTIGRIAIDDASADFADLSLPLPFSAKIAALNGELSTISTASAEPSTISLDGSVDEFGQVRISGTLTPLDPPANTNVRVAFQNVDMPKFSAYSIPFAGREIAGGRLDLDLGYQITDRRLAGENNIVLRDFELGDKVEHPGAMSLPLGLAVALLKDPDGNIDIDLPVEGDLDDPEFRIGGVVMSALGNLITRIVTSPFALLANLVGAEADELEYIVFDPGQGELSPPELEKAGKIAEALALRPELALEISGVFAEVEDGEAIRTRQFDEEVEVRIDALSNDAMYADNRRTVIEALFAESGIAADVPTALAEMQLEYTPTATDETPGELDELAYVEALCRDLIETRTVSETELLDLANQRAAALEGAIIAIDASIGPRIVTTESAEPVDLDEDVVPMQIRLTAGSELGVQTDATPPTNANPQSSNGTRR